MGETTHPLLTLLLCKYENRHEVAWVIKWHSNDEYAEVWNGIKRCDRHHKLRYLVSNRYVKFCTLGRTRCCFDWTAAKFLDSRSGISGRTAGISRCIWVHPPISGWKRTGRTADAVQGMSQEQHCSVYYWWWIEDALLSRPARVEKWARLSDGYLPDRTGSVQTDHGLLQDSVWEVR